MTDKKVIIGFGTGRCGTLSLAKFLNQQEGFNITHEGAGLALYPVLSDTDDTLNSFVKREGNIIGDVGFYWLHYVGIVLRRYPNVKTINIQRDIDETVESFWNYKAFTREYKSFMENDWFPFPYNSHEPTKDAIYRTIKEYRILERELSCYFTNHIFCIQMEELNNLDSMKRLLDWLGCEKKILTTFHENKREQLLASKNAQTERLLNFRRS